MRTPHWQLVRKDIAALSPSSALQNALGSRPDLVDKPWVVLEALVYSLNALLEAETGSSDHNTYGTMRAVAFLQMFALQGAQVYKIGEDFGRVLMKADLKAPVAALEYDGIIRCIEFPDSIEFNMGDGDWGRVAYVAAYARVDEDDKYFILEGEKFDLRVEIVVPLMRLQSRILQSGHDNIRVMLKSGEDLETGVTRSLDKIAKDGHQCGFSVEMVSYIVKCLLYIHSGEPDLRAFRPMLKPRHSDPKKHVKAIERWRASNWFDIPVTLVGFDYQKPRQYAVDETFVDTHLRWQPCGPGRRQVKLVWVSPHVRHFKKTDTGQ